MCRFTGYVHLHCNSLSITVINCGKWRKANNPLYHIVDSVTDVLYGICHITIEIYDIHQLHMQKNKVYAKKYMKKNINSKVQLARLVKDDNKMGIQQPQQ